MHLKILTDVAKPHPHATLICRILIGAEGEEVLFAVPSLGPGVEGLEGVSVRVSGRGARAGLWAQVCAFGRPCRQLGWQGVEQ